MTTPGLQGYCMHCKTTREIANPIEGVMRNNKPVTKGECPICKTPIFRLGGIPKGGAK